MTKFSVNDTTDCKVIEKTFYLELLFLVTSFSF